MPRLRKSNDDDGQGQEVGVTGGQPDKQRGEGGAEGGLEQDTDGHQGADQTEQAHAGQHDPVHDELEAVSQCHLQFQRKLLALLLFPTA